eukprot:TRINITY_DN5683_c0_g1_i6.p1 TRINITY_DN5683_c0_g1~~TRINITY_DN5683_c0_g1_i6.p1  ORF type:complete len:553 (-),score=200.04 TRINITY_DN5683_c0_g1_i6:1113-2576(-)
MGAGASTASVLKAIKDRRYLQGMKPDKYFTEVMLPLLAETLEVLSLEVDEGLQLFLRFVLVDAGNQGQVSLKDFHAHFALPLTKFSERIFSTLDLDGSGRLDFREFLVGIWNFCTYDTRLLARYVFLIFDVDARAFITVPECDALLRMLAGSAEADPAVLKLLAPHGDGDGDGIGYDEFLAVAEKHRQVMKPALDMQRSMRASTLGVDAWEKKTKARREDFKEAKGGDTGSWEAVEIVLEEKRQARAAELAKRRAEAEAQLLAAKALDDEVSEEEKERARKRQARAQVAGARSPEELKEEELWEELRLAREACANAAWTIDTLDDARAARARLWGAAEAAMAASDNAAAARLARQLEVATNDDAQHKADAWIAMNRDAFAARVTRAYCDLHAAAASGGAMSDALAQPPGSPTGSGGLSWTARIVKLWPDREARSAAERAARADVVQRFAKQEENELRERFNGAAAAGAPRRRSEGLLGQRRASQQQR